jgi:hypothetical protein
MRVEAMDSQLLVGLAAAVFALWAAVFATRADLATRHAKALADRRWDDTIRPVPHFSFTSAPSVGQPIEVEVENLGGALAAGAVIVQHGDDLFAGELTLPDKAPPRRILLTPVLKAWQRSNQPRCLLLAGRDISGRTWDCLDGAKVIKDPRRWIAGQLKELRLQGIVDFPGIAGTGK